MAGTAEKLIRYEGEDNYGSKLWIEVRRFPSGHREVWDCASYFDDQAEAVEWLRSVTD